MYGESARLLRERLPKLGIETTFVDDPTPEAYVAACEAETRVFYIESPSNPTLAVTDVRAIAAAGPRARHQDDRRQHVRDPVLPDAARPRRRPRRPLDDEGASAATATRSAARSPAREDARRRARETRVVKGFGGVMSPLTAYLVARGMRHVRAAAAARVLDGGAARAGASPSTPRSRASTTLPSSPRSAREHMHAYRLAPVVRARASERVSRAGRAVLERVKLVHARGEPRRRAHARDAPRDDDAREHARADRARARNRTDGLLRLSVGLEAADVLERDLLAALEFGLNMRHFAWGGHLRKSASSRVARRKSA